MGTNSSDGSRSDGLEGQGEKMFAVIFRLAGLRPSGSGQERVGGRLVCHCVLPVCAHCARIFGDTADCIGT